MTIHLKRINRFGEGGASPTPPPPTPQGEYFVKVIDYDGTILDEQWVDDGTEYTLPSAPSHTGLVFQEWSCTQAISNNKVTVDKSDIMIGAVYTTVSGQNEFDIKLNDVTGKTVTLKLDGNKDWGDGTTDTSTSHTYTDYGEYTIKCDGTTFSTSSGATGIFGQKSSERNFYCVAVRLAFQITSDNGYDFAYCMNVKYVTISNTVRTLSQYAFYYDYSLKGIVIPPTINQQGLTFSIGQYAFGYCKCIQEIVFPYNIHYIGNNAFQNCTSLQRLVLVKGSNSFGNNIFQNSDHLERVSLVNITTLPQSCFSSCINLKTVKHLEIVSTFSASSFSSCTLMLEYDFSKATAIPTIDSGTFGSINALCQIKVPSSLYSSWRTSGNWSYYTSYIVSVGE